MLDVSGNSVTAHYHEQPNARTSAILRFRANGPYNNYLVDSDATRGPLAFHYTIHAPQLANLLRRYQGLYRELLSGMMAPVVDITSEAECQRAEEILSLKPEFPEGWDKLGNEALALHNQLDSQAREDTSLDVRVEYALVTKLMTDIVEPFYTWEDLKKKIADYKSSTALPAPSLAQQLWSWVSGSSKKSTPTSAPAAPTITLTAPTRKQAPSTDNKMGAPQISTASPPRSPPSYPSPPPYSPPRSSAVGCSVPGSPARSSPKLLSPTFSGPTTGVSKGSFTPVKVVAFLPPKEVEFSGAGTFRKFGPRTPPAKLPLGDRVIDFLTDHAGPIQIVLGALSDSL
ncbi:hypothetical protein P7C70_g7136, partial [Phenoliferia sp. Uapishka_3]